MPRHTLLTLFFSLFHSNVSYLIEVYGTASKTSLKRIETLQRRALKSIFNLPRQFSTLQLYERVKTLNIVPVKALHYVAVTTFAHKVINGFSHCNIIIAEDNPTRRTRRTRRYRLQRARSESAKRAFSYEAKLLGNHLSGIYSSSLSIAKLKRQVRSFLCDDVTVFDGLLNCERLS